MNISLYVAFHMHPSIILTQIQVKYICLWTLNSNQSIIVRKKNIRGYYFRLPYNNPKHIVHVQDGKNKLVLSQITYQIQNKNI